MIDRPRLVGVSGSLRQGSFCTAILRTAAEQIAGEVDFDLFWLETIPPYNQDMDSGNPPEPVRTLPQAIGDAVVTV